MNKPSLRALVTAFGLAGFAGTAPAALHDVDPGPYTAATGYFPLYYTDIDGPSGLTLDLCLSKATSPDPAAAGGLLCSLVPNPGVFDPEQPIVFPVNFPDEAFYFTADANVAGEGIDLLYIAHLEAAFAAGLPVPGDQITFARIRVRGDFDVTVPTPGVYRVIHPYGVEEFTVNAPGRRVINFTRDIGIGAPGVFTGALAGDIGPFLRRADSAGGDPSPFIESVNPETGQTEQFIGDPNVPQFATGSPFGTNFVRIERITNLGGNPTGDHNVSTDQFFLSGRVWSGQRPTAVTVDRATYSRSAAAGTRIDVFASSTPDAGLCFRELLALVGNTDPCLRNMTGDGAGQFFGQDTAALTLPPYVVVTATDPAGSPPTTPTVVARALTDVVKVGKAQYARNTRQLSIAASSSDEVNVPALTAVGVPALDGSGNAKLSLVPGTPNQTLTSAAMAEPPASVTVVSSKGGRRTVPVTVVATAAVNGNPVALPDAATTAEDAAVTVAVLANDTDPDGDALAVTGVSAATNGTATLNADGTVTFTPAPNFNGTGGFNYAISDGNGGTAGSSATVTVTAVNDPPVAVNDAAATVPNTAVNINVLANDSDPDNVPPAAANAGLTVSAVTQPANGTAAINSPATSVRYTPNANFSGTSTFSYTIRDPDGLPATATVTVTVAPGVDLDIARFTVPNSGRVGRALSAVTIDVRNGGTVNAPRNATLTGTQNGVQVYSRSRQVNDPAGGGTSQFAFPAFTPTATGNIAWRVEIFDDNADADVATGTTTVPR